MVMRPKPMDVPFTQGLAQNQDEGLAAPGTFSTIENVIYDEIGNWQKRKGFTDLSDYFGLTDFEQLGVSSGSSVMITSAGRDSSFGSIASQPVDPNSWVDMRVPAAGEILENDIALPQNTSAASTATSLHAPSAAIGGYVITANVSLVSGANHQVWAVVTDDSTGLVVAELNASSTAHYTVRCWRVDDRLYVGWVDTSTWNVNVDYFDTGSPSSGFSGTVAVGTSAVDSTAVYWDACWGPDVTSPDRWFLAYAKDITGTKYVHVDAIDFSGSVYDFWVSGPVASGVEWISIVLQVDELSVVWQDGAFDIWISVRDATNLASQILATTLVDGTPTAAARPLASQYTQGNGGKTEVFHEETYTSGVITGVSTRSNVVTHSGGSVAGPGDAFKQLRLVSKPFTLNSGTTGNYNNGPLAWAEYTPQNVPAVSGGALQSCFLLLQLSNSLGYRVLGRAAYQRAFSSTDQFPGEIGEPSTGRLVWSGLHKQFSADGIDYRGKLHVIDLSRKDRLTAVELRGHVCTSGSLPSYVNNGSSGELGMILAPDQIGLTAVVGGGSVAPGTYQYSVMWEVLDSSGRVYRSGVAVPESVTVSSTGYVSVVTGVPAQSVMIQNQGQNPDISTSGQPIKVHFYRTAAGGNVFYYLDSLSVPSSSRAAPWNSLTYADTQADSAITDNAVLYTDFEAEEFHPPSGTATCVHGDRLWIAANATLYHSKWFRSDYGPQFVPTFKIEMPERCTALASIGQSLVAFGKSQIYAVFGDGPDNAGVGGFNPTQVVTGSMGCPESLGGQRSIAVFPAGVLFRSESGISVLPRGLGEPQVISEPIRDTLADYPEITSVIVDEKEQRVYFTARNSAGDDHKILVYDYHHNVWCTWTGAWLAESYVVGGIHDEQYVVATSVVDSYGIYGQSTSSYVDPSDADITAKFTLHPLKPFGFHGEGRVWSTIVSGNNGAGTFMIKATDQDGTEKSRTFSNTGAFNVAFENPIQRVATIQYEITESSQTAFSMLGLTLMAAKERERRQRPSERL